MVSVFVAINNEVHCSYQHIISKLTHDARTCKIRAASDYSTMYGQIYKIIYKLVYVGLAQAGANYLMARSKCFEQGQIEPRKVANMAVI